MGSLKPMAAPGASPPSFCPGEGGGRNARRQTPRYKGARAATSLGEDGAASAVIRSSRPKAPEAQPSLTAWDRGSAAAWCRRLKRRDALAGARRPPRRGHTDPVTIVSLTLEGAVVSRAGRQRYRATRSAARAIVSNFSSALAAAVNWSVTGMPAQSSQTGIVIATDLRIRIGRHRPASAGGQIAPGQH
jgi:hypothetical protein